MKKIVFCLVALYCMSPVTIFAEEMPSTPGNATIESSSELESTQETIKDDLEISDSSFSSTDVESTETSSSYQSAFGDFFPTTLTVLQGEAVTAEMLAKDLGYHGANMDELKLLEQASTEELGENWVKVSFVINPFPLDAEEVGRETITLKMSYIVVKTAPTYAIQFVSYDSEKNEVKGRVSSINGSSIKGISIHGLALDSRSETIISTIKELYPINDTRYSTTTDAEGYFALSYQNNFNFAAFSLETGDYSPVYTLTDEAIVGATKTEDSFKPVVSTEASEKKQEQKKGVFPNTGEQKTFFFSILGIAIILLAVLFLFINSKKNKK